MKTHLFKIIREIVLIVIVIIISLVGISYIINLVQANRVADHLLGKVKKTELRILSPVFGTIDSLPVHEGQLVKKGDILARINFSGNEKDTSKLQNSLTFRFDSNNELTVISPEDSIVVQTLFAEGSTLKPDSDFLVLYPLKDAMVEFTLPSVDSKIIDYKDFGIVGVEDNKAIISLTPSNTAPVIGFNNERLYYAIFSNLEDSKFFYNDQVVDIKADKKGSNNLIFSGVVLQFQNITGQISDFVTHLLKK